MADLAEFSLRGDQNGNSPVFLNPVTAVNALVLAANVAESITIPAGATRAIVYADGDYYVRCNATAAIPSGDVTDGTAALVNLPCIDLQGETGVTSISFIASAARIITVAFFK